MPGFTPNLSLTYPTIDDVIDAAAWQTLSNQIDAQLSVTDLLRQQTLHRPTVNCTGFTAGVAPATTTNINFNTSIWTIPSTFHSTSVNNDQFLVPSSGLYFVTGDVSANSGTTETRLVGGVSLNGTVYFQASNAGNTLVVSISCNPKGLIACNAGDIIRVFGNWAGTGTATLGADVQIFKLANL